MTVPSLRLMRDSSLVLAGTYDVGIVVTQGTLGDVVSGA